MLKNTDKRKKLFLLKRIKKQKLCTTIKQYNNIQLALMSVSWSIILL